jgi:nicotinate-nucleotide adenylyltransferase
MKIGVLGGTFDPVHRGHILIAEEARGALALSEVLAMPAGRPMLKANERITPIEHRLAMLHLAVAGIPWIKVSTMEIERPGPSYTVDTVTELWGRLGSSGEIYFIIGWDSLAHFPDWREPGRIIKMCKLAAVPRPGVVRPDIRTMEKSVPGISNRVVFLDGPITDISSTVIREKASRGESIDDLVPGPVADYIREYKLYE